MEIETLNAMNEGMYLSLMMIKVILLVAVFFAIAGFAIYLAGTAWFCYVETRRSITAPRTARRTSPPNTRKPMPRVPDTQARTTFVNKPCANARCIASRPGALIAGAASTPSA
jgi:hypothetical protein